jgi:GntR family transcriptional repressor for pyruvate dehydrogenase complex
VSIAEQINTGKRETVVEAIAHGLIRYIAEKGLRAGDRLPPERELVQMVGASRLPLREALCVLKGLGILEARHGKGVFVKPLDLGAVFGTLSPLLRTHADIDIQHIFQVRLHLEASVAEVAAASRSDQNVETLGQTIDWMRESVEDRPAYIQHDMAFHQELARSTRNPIFHVFMASITDLLVEVQFLYRDNVEIRRHAVEEHAEILDAVRAGDGPRARAAMQTHLRHAMERM